MRILFPINLKWRELLETGDNAWGYNGREEQAGFGLPYLDYGARLYDPATGRWLTQDPLSEKYHGISPYAFCAGNPMKYVDVDGNAFSPIYDLSGNFLGTDDEGLQGDYIVMDAEYFQQGMQHSDALERNREEGQDIQDKIAEHYEYLPFRPDYDGYLTRAEANSWWLGKSGEPLFVDQSKISLPGISTKSFNNKEGNTLYKNFIWNLSETGQVYGTLKMTLIDRNRGFVHIGNKGLVDIYDFEMDGRPLRDIATWIGRPGKANAGKSFLIYGYGRAIVPIK